MICEPHLFGSRTSESSRRMLAESYPILSISSMSRTGFRTPDWRIFWMMRLQHGTDIGPSVSSNLRFVPHPAQRHGDDFSFRSLATDLPRDVFPTPGGPTEAEPVPSSFRGQFPDCGEFEDTFHLTFSSHNGPPRIFSAPPDIEIVRGHKIPGAAKQASRYRSMRLSLR